MQIVFASLNTFTYTTTPYDEQDNAKRTTFLFSIECYFTTVIAFRSA